MVTCISRSPEETADVGADWGRAAAAGWVLGLSGELGAGKTQLVKGLAQGLGIRSRVHSPTFVLVNHYSGGRLPLIHLDLYRLETAEQIASAGLEEFLRVTDSVVVIEWAERWFGPAAGLPDPLTASLSPSNGGRVRPPARWRWVQIDTLSQTERRIVYEDLGA